MHRGEEVRADILLGILELSSVPLSPETLVRNFGVDQQRAQNTFEQLVLDGYARRVEDGYYDIAPEGKDRVLTRSPAD